VSCALLHAINNHTPFVAALCATYCRNSRITSSKVKHCQLDECQQNPENKNLSKATDSPVPMSTLAYRFDLDDDLLLSASAQKFCSSSFRKRRGTHDIRQHDRRISEEKEWDTRQKTLPYQCSFSSASQCEPYCTYIQS
jgi:hypothetical protein